MLVLVVNSNYLDRIIFTNLVFSCKCSTNLVSLFSAISPMGECISAIHGEIWDSNDQI